MDSFERRSVAEQLKILEILRQQLKSTLQLATLLEEQPGPSTQRQPPLKCHALLRQAVETGCSRANKSTTDATGQQWDKINLKIKELEGRTQKKAEVKAELNFKKGSDQSAEDFWNSFGCPTAPDAFDRRPFSAHSPFGPSAPHATVQDDEDETMTGT